MMNLFRSSKYSRNKPRLETIDREICDPWVKPKLPRHLSALESATHSSIDRLGKANQNAKIFSQDLNYEENQAIELAVSISRYQLSDRPSQQKHLENLRCNLHHRLEVAVAVGNSQLVKMLQEEFRQLEASV